MQRQRCYYIVDAVGVTESDKTIRSRAGDGPKIKVLTLGICWSTSHTALTDENLELLRDYCSTINHRYEDNPLFITS